MNILDTGKEIHLLVTRLNELDRLFQTSKFDEDNLNEYKDINYKLTLLVKKSLN
jgi:hypothetical protein